MEDYKVIYEMKDGSMRFVDWTTEKKARKEFERLKKSCECRWAELVHCPLDDETCDEEWSIDFFVRRCEYIFGKPVLLEIIK